MVYGQLKRNQNVIAYVRALGGCVIHLLRENTLRAVASVLFRKQAKRGGLSGEFPIHTDVRVPRFSAHLEVNALVNGMRVRRKQEAVWRRNLGRAGVPVLEVTYNGMTGGEQCSPSAMEQAATVALCEFLGVAPQPLTSPLVKGNRWPLSKTVANWEDVRAAVLGTEFAEFAEYEDRWN
jgi:LPS sulfotransferase NodH